MMSKSLLPFSLTWGFSPMLTSLRLFGLLWPWPCGTTHYPRWRLVGQFHVAIVTVMVTMHAGRFLMLYGGDTSFGPNLMLKAVVHVWSLEKLLVNIVIMRGVWRYLQRVLSQWEKYKKQYAGVTRRYIRHTVTKIVLAVNLIFLLCSVCSIFFLSLYMKQMTRLLMTPLYSSDSEVPIYIAFIFYTLYFYLAFGWLQPFLLLSLICFLLRHEFLLLSRDLRRSLSRDKLRELSVEHFRRRHDALCGVVSLVDDMLGVFCLVVYALSVPLVCMFVFMVVYARDVFGDDAIAIAACVVCLLVVIIHVLVITVIATSLATASKSPKQLLYSLDLSQYSGTDVTSVQTFLFRLSSEHLGLTVWKLLNIDRHLFVTLCAVVVSYVLILFKFSLALGENHTDTKSPLLRPANTTTD